MVKPILFTLSVLAALAPAVADAAQTQTSQTQNAPSHRGRVFPKTNPVRPKMPSRFFIDCAYAGGVISFEANFDFDSMLVIIGEPEAPVFSADITPDDATVTVGYLYGEYTVTCITDDGREFSGSLYF